MSPARLPVILLSAFAAGAAHAQAPAGTDPSPRPPPERTDRSAPFREPGLFPLPRPREGPILPYNPGFDDGPRDRGARAAGSTFSYMGQQRPRLRTAPYRWPRGHYYAARPAGSVLAPALVLDNYRIRVHDRRRFGFADPAEGEVWLRVGDDALRVRRVTGEILESVAQAYY